MTFYHIRFSGDFRDGRDHSVGARSDEMISIDNFNSVPTKKIIYIISRALRQNSHEMLSAKLFSGALPPKCFRRNHVAGLPIDYHKILTSIILWDLVPRKWFSCERFEGLPIDYHKTLSANLSCRRQVAKMFLKLTLCGPVHPPPRFVSRFLHQSVILSSLPTLSIPGLMLKI